MQKVLQQRSVLFIGLLLGSCALQAAESLPKLGVDIKQTSVSGISSGGYMAVQFHMAHSSIVKGVGVFAGGPYFCSKGSFKDATAKCMQPKDHTFLPDVASLIAHANEVAKSGEIDAVENLKGARVFLFSGKNDKVVFQPVMDKLKEYYTSFVDPANIVYKNDLNAGHAMITDNYGNPCDFNGSPFLNNCHYNGAEQVLSHVYGKLNPPSEKAEGRLLEFNQEEFVPNGRAESYGLAKTGYAYIPKACETSRCKIHIFFHGCLQNAATVGKELIENAGYNRFADTNNFVILYPQTTTISAISLDPSKANPMGCWDWWGYSSKDFYSKDAPQIKAVMAMIEQLAISK
jgi:poly(3-hydroxybutyrate) depolymerase